MDTYYDKTSLGRNNNKKISAIVSISPRKSKNVSLEREVWDQECLRAFTECGCSLASALGQVTDLFFPPCKSSCE